MFDSIIAKIVLGWIRHFVSMGGTALVAHGYLTLSQGQEFTGALMTIVPLLFSAYDKFQAQQAAQAKALAQLQPQQQKAS